MSSVLARLGNDDGPGCLHLGWREVTVSLRWLALGSPMKHTPNIQGWSTV